MSSSSSAQVTSLPRQQPLEAEKVSRNRDDSCTDCFTEEDVTTPPIRPASAVFHEKKADMSVSVKKRMSSDLKGPSGASSAPGKLNKEQMAGKSLLSSTFSYTNNQVAQAANVSTPDMKHSEKPPEPRPLVPANPNAAVETPRGEALYKQPIENKKSSALEAATPSPNSATRRGASAVATPAAGAFGSQSGTGSIGFDSFEKWKVGERYNLIKILGHGSYGQVAEAYDKVKKQKVAIKCITNVFDQEIDTKRILREVCILRHLKHENVIRLLNIVTTDPKDFNEVYLVFEFVDTDLHKLINSPQYLTIEHVKTFLYQMLCALKYIHSCLVIHRDVKPANILLNEDCGLKICDFGLARVVSKRRFVGDTAAATAAEAERTAKARRKRPRTGNGDDPLGASENPDEKRPATRSRSRSKSTDDEVGVVQNSENERVEKKERGKNEPKRLMRQLTKHVVTRWYRPPELILLQEYTNAVDMWSVGCIFAELLSMQKGSVKSFKDRAPLFPGKSCFPLSADHDKTYKDRLDQLNVIFAIIGTPGEEDIAHLGEVRHYLGGLPKKKRKDFRKIFKAAPDDALDLLNKMLMFDPKNRISIDAAIEHPFLKTVRISTTETLAPEGLLTPVDAVPLSKEKLREKLLEEREFYADENSLPLPIT
mmetsp:Transcript_19023/g.31727  ORF Transcript_19023/g.31727 Transcript_19023/m.31727 type:complete len:653 (-) Transcript_19023:506-2464(-)